MNLSFQPQFKNRILGGTKIHTIRADKTDRWKVGNTIHFCTGLRTKEYNCFEIGECTRIDKIKIEHFEDFVNVYLNEWLLGEANHHGLDDIYQWNNDLLDLAKNDGFENLESFFEWFNSDFEGKLIHWTEFKY